MKTTQALREEFDRTFELDDHGESTVVQDMVFNFFLKDREDVLKETEKAFGGCKLCYGKGYSTEQQGYVGSSRDVFRGPKLEVHPCSCERGKQMQELFKLKD